MRFIQRILGIAGKVFWPIRKNATFFLFMFLVGYACCQLEVSPRGGKPYSQIVPELFLDLYALCLILSLIPRKIRPWIRFPLYLIIYIAAIADLYCFVRFGSTLTPTMLLLVGETDKEEASEFVRSYISWDLFGSKLGWIFLILLINIATFIASRFLRNKKIKISFLAEGILGIACLAALIVSISETYANKKALLRLMSYDNIGEVENELTKRDHGRLYTPVHRLAFSLYANRLASAQVDRLKESVDQCDVANCLFLSDNIILIIGESFNKYHSQLYGYDHPTTPYQLQLEEEGRLVAFTDVVAPWNLTSFVFKNIFSLHSVGDSGQWCDYPLFPVLFRKSGYKVWFMTNQFLPKAKEAVYDFSGGFFLNDPYLSDQQFDVRNTERYKYDAGLLVAFDSISLRENPYNQNLIIFHLKGQHVNYRDKYPSYRRCFGPSDYNWPDLNEREKRILADYDNATLYNDSIVGSIVRRFEDKDAIIIYFSDHGEEAFGEGVRLFGRNHSATIDYRLAREEYEIPFWIWWSDKYALAHPEVVSRIKEASSKPFMTDNLPHVLLYLAGIECRWYDSRLNLLSPDYFEERDRIIKDSTNYDKLRRDAVSRSSIQN